MLTTPSPVSDRGFSVQWPICSLRLRAALYDRMQPLYTGEVKPDGIDLNFIRIEQPRPIFDRMSGGEEFDVAEYSSSEYIQRYANKKCNFVAIPVFPSRTFRHCHHRHQQEASSASRRTSKASASASRSTP